MILLFTPSISQSFWPERPVVRKCLSSIPRVRFGAPNRGARNSQFVMVRPPITARSSCIVMERVMGLEPTPSAASRRPPQRSRSLSYTRAMNQMPSPPTRAAKMLADPFACVTHDTLAAIRVKRVTALTVAPKQEASRGKGYVARPRAISSPTTRSPCGRRSFVPLQQGREIEAYADAADYVFQNESGHSVEPQ